MRYQQGSTQRNNSSAPDPALSADGRSLQFSAGNLAPGESVQISYVAEVTVGAPLGEAINVATAQDDRGLTSNTARAIIQIEDDLLTSRSFILGRVMLGNCEVDQPGTGTDAGLAGVAGVRLIMEDGRYVITDEKGMYHFEGLVPGTHVVQVDPLSIPEHLEIFECEQNTRFAGSAHSQFADVAGGLIWRSDFYLREKAPLSGSEQTVTVRKPVTDSAGKDEPIMYSGCRQQHRRSSTGPGWTRPGRGWNGCHRAVISTRASRRSRLPSSTTPASA